MEHERGLEVSHLNKRFGNTTACDDVTFEISRGELLTLLGPSGCGKTTTLRCVIGFERPDSGEICVGARRVTLLPPNRRDMGLVFQNWAVWPHMTVAKNIAFGLSLKKLPRRAIEKRVAEVLEMVSLSGFEDRYPGTLSGGQKQRVALARTLAIEPSVLLLDEPLSNLDAKLRRETRLEIAAIQKQLLIPTLYVTHDQAEALAMSDRIGVMQRGRIVQMASPSEIYRQPASMFVAEFIGESNVLRTVVVAEDGQSVDLKLAGRTHRVSKSHFTSHVSPGQIVYVAARPESMAFDRSAYRDVIPLEAQIKHEVFEGERLK
jgi:ABC-type Fe3+/spermidine/putrescine transport system ATPase subunit